jgi:hypothetical protein
MPRIKEKKTGEKRKVDASSISTGRKKKCRTTGNGPEMKVTGDLPVPWFIKIWD